MTYEERAFVAENRVVKLEAVARAMCDWIDALPKELQLPAMPGFDRDWADDVVAGHPVAMNELAELRLAAERYETARRMNPRQWADVWKLNISTGKPFDEIIDNLRPFMMPGAGS